VACPLPHQNDIVFPADFHAQQIQSHTKPIVRSWRS
jgi:hypothetical protein